KNVRNEKRTRSFFFSRRLLRGRRGFAPCIFSFLPAARAMSVLSHVLDDVTVDDRLTQGVTAAVYEYGDKFETVSHMHRNAIVRIDNYGWHMSWKCDGRVPQLLDLSTAWQVRKDELPTGPDKITELRKFLTDQCFENGDSRVVWLMIGTGVISVTHIFLVCDDRDAAMMFRSQLPDLIKRARFGHHTPLTVVLKKWREVTLKTDVHGQIELSWIANLFKGGSMSDRQLLKCAFNAFGKLILSPDDVTLTKFISMIYTLDLFPRIKTIFDSICGGTSSMTPQKLHDFLDKQRDTCTGYDDKSMKLIMRKYQIEEQQSDLGMSFGDFLLLLLSEEAAMVASEGAKDTDSMTHPLSSYFINSSHNSYLTGRQILGDSSSDIYRTLLLSGVRCIEIDAWNGKDGVVVTHGHAYCRKIPLKDVLHAIKDSAFEYSHLPVILSLENHCGLSDMEMPDESEEDLNDPNDLTKLINSASRFQLWRRAASYKWKKGPSEIHHDLSAIVNYCQTVSFKSFEESKEKGMAHEMCSFDEIAARLLVMNSPEKFAIYNSSHLSRIYPDGTKWMSQNFDPHEFWCIGSQLVALNIQTNDKFNQLNRGMFEKNKYSGYVLKPEYLQRPDTFINPFTATGTPIFNYKVTGEVRGVLDIKRWF
ncbi:hypothetical protein PRIPAC_70268, partial [Pristionchus pacificus]|uniref:Phosphoinositide phospholipase C n=1 Tax=Pristionchus pacificus TaxID=54126 RepID=A0A2A6C5L0_PRIPA